MPSDEQNTAHVLMTKNTQGSITLDERKQLENFSHRSDRLMLRKAEAAPLLKQRQEK